MKAKHFKKLRKKGKWFDCYHGCQKPTQVFALSPEEAARKCMFRKHIECSSRWGDALETSESFAKVIVYPEGKRFWRFRKLYK